jgi:uncharacterized protein (DUF362 family)
MHKHWTRREWIGGVTSAALSVPALSASPVLTGKMSSKVSIVRCSSYSAFPAQLALACDQLGGLGRLVRGKTVAVKLNLTGNPRNFPLSETLPYRTNGQSVADLVALLAKSGARRVRLIESFFPASNDPALWARYGLDVNAIDNIGTKVEWANVQNLGGYKQYVRLKVPWGGYMYPAYYLNPAFTECDTYVSFAKLKNHWIAGVTLSMKNNFGNTPCSLYGSDCGPSGNEKPTKERGDVLHAGTTKAPSGVDPELHPDSPRDPGYRVPRILVDQVGIRPIDLAIIDGVETVRGGEGPWLKGLERMTPGVIIGGLNPVSTDAVSMAVMSYDVNADRGQSCFIRGDNSLKLAEAASLGTRDLSRIEVTGVSIADAKLDFGPGAVGKTLAELRA